MKTKQAPLSKAANAAAYEDVSRMVYRLCWVAVIRWGGEWDEYLSAANAAYMRAYQTHDPAKGAFTTHVWWSVKGALLGVRDGRGKGREVAETDLCHEGGKSLADAPARRESTIVCLLRELGEDGRVILTLLIDTPGELARLCRVSVEPRRGCVTPEAARRLIGEYLRERHGWSRGRVVDAFADVREAVE